MALLDSIVGAAFRDEKAGRVVVFQGDRRNRGYLVKSEAEELKIRSFLKMFYFAHFSILVLGYFLAFEWSRELYYSFGRPDLHLFRSMGITAGFYLVVAGVPYFLFWRSYKKAFLSFASAQDEVVVSGKRAGRKQILIGVALVVLSILLLFGGFLLVRAK